MTDTPDNPAWQATVEIEVPFFDIDAAGIAWHGHYVKYFEIARCNLLESIDFNYAQMRASGYGWPIVDLRVRYPHPARFGQRIAVNVRIKEYEHRLRMSYLITDVATGQRLTRGSTVQVAVNIATGQMCYRSPDVLLEKLGVL